MPRRPSEADIRRLPRDWWPDSTLPLLRQGYLFLPNRFRQLKTDIFRGRLMLKRAFFISGPEASALLYDTEKFIRHGAMPLRVQKTLTGKKGVQTLDGEHHRHRKAMFMQLMSEESRQYLMQRVEYHWQQALECWKQEPQIVLFHEMQRIFFRAACDWTGIPYREEEVADCACDLGAMIDGFGGVGKRYRKGKAARKRMEQWAARWITDYRADHWANHQANRLATPPDSLTNHPAEVIALHAELNGTLLSPHVAAVELLNLIRPIVAIATYVAFMAHALHHYPEERSKLLAEEAYTEYFVQEVRRYYPFTPFVGAKTRQSFEWKGYHFPAGQLVILDVYGIDHDPRIWERPEAFLPERFRHWQENAHDFIPQGGGHYATGHRCAGEWITIDCMKTVLHLLLALEYHTPPQPWGFDLHRMPTRPKSGVMTNHIRSI